MAVATTSYTDKTDDQKAMTEMVRQFVDEQIIPNAEKYDHEDSYPEPIVEQMKELGLFGVTIPEEYGGLGESPDDLHDDRRGALARLDLDLGHRQHPLHRLLPAHEVRHRGAEGEVPPEDGDGRDCARRSRSPSPSSAPTSRRSRRAPPSRTTAATRSTARRCGSPTASCPALVLRARQDREDRPALQGHDVLHRREGAGRLGEHRRAQGLHRPAQDQEDGLQGRRVHRARLRRLQHARRQHPRRRGGGPRPGLHRR